MRIGAGSSLRGVRRRGAGLDFPFATINIVLLLLFFFIVNGSIVGGNEHRVAAPLLAEAEPGRLPRPLLVVGRDGALFLDDQAIGRGELASRAQAAVKAGSAPAAPLNILADRQSSGADFLVLIEAIRAAGIPVRIISVDTGAKG